MVKITAKAGEGGRLFGAVTAKEISEALAEQHRRGRSPRASWFWTNPSRPSAAIRSRAKLGYEVVGTVNVMVAEA